MNTPSVNKDGPQGLPAAAEVIQAAAEKTDGATVLDAAVFTKAGETAPPPIALRVMPLLKSLEIQSPAALSASLEPVGGEIKLTIRW